jgi:hypothetical protein
MKVTRRVFSLTSAILVLTSISGKTIAATGHCCRCGCVAVTKKICRPVAEKKKVKETEYDCECEDFCIPGPSTLIGCETECGDCGEAKVKKIWQPNCGEVRTRNVLKKSTEESEKTVYKWVVEEVCVDCERRMGIAGRGNGHGCNGANCNGANCGGANCGSGNCNGGCAARACDSGCASQGSDVTPVVGATSANTTRNTKSSSSAAQTARRFPSSTQKR